jgi:hypothetical protein
MDFTTCRINPNYKEDMLYFVAKFASILNKINYKPTFAFVCLGCNCHEEGLSLRVAAKPPIVLIVGMT